MAHGLPPRPRRSTTLLTAFTRATRMARPRRRSPRSCRQSRTHRGRAGEIVSFDSDYIDLAIGLAVVFLLASLVVSGLNEACAWLFRRRAKFLWAWLYNLV